MDQETDDKPKGDNLKSVIFLLTSISLASGLMGGLIQKVTEGNPAPQNTHYPPNGTTIEQSLELSAKTDSVLLALGKTINVDLVLKDPSNQEFASINLSHPGEAAPFIKQLAQLQTKVYDSDMYMPFVFIKVKDAHDNAVCNISLPAATLANLLNHAAADPATFKTAQSLGDLAKICGKSLNDIKVEYQQDKFSEGTLPYKLINSVKADPIYQGGKYAAAIEEARVGNSKDKSIG